MATTHPRIWTVEEYHRMSSLGIIKQSERVELVGGQIITMAAKNPPHSVITQLISDYLKEVLGVAALVRTQEPISLSSTSEPEPDIAVVQPDLIRYIDHHPYPEEVLAVIEVADNTLNYDRKRKAVLYAQAGIPDYWVVDVKGKQVFVFRQAVGRYQQEVIVSGNANLSLVAFPDIAISISRFFPN